MMDAQQSALNQSYFALLNEQQRNLGSVLGGLAGAQNVYPGVQGQYLNKAYRFRSIVPRRPMTEQQARLLIIGGLRP